MFRMKGNIPDVDNPEESNELTEADKVKLLRGGRIVRIVRCFWGFFILAMTVVGVEKIISFNDLSPQKSLSRPGQMIPFVLGIITVIEGVASACMPKPLSGHNNSLSNNSRRGSTVDVTHDQGPPRKVRSKGEKMGVLNFS